MTDSHPAAAPTRAELRRTSRVLTVGTWILIGAVCTFSAMTGAQFIGAHSPWRWSGWVLAAAIDIAFVMALQADATLARYGANSGRWPAAFRWLTGTFSVFVNIGDAAISGDLIGIPVHLIAPALLLVLGEAGPAWRRQLVVLGSAPGTTRHEDVPTPPVGIVMTEAPGQPEAPHTPADTMRSDSTVRHPAHTSKHCDVPGNQSDPVRSANPASTTPPADAREARARIVQGRLEGLSQRETARRAHRSPAFVRKIWTAMDAGARDRPPDPRDGASPTVL